MATIRVGAREARRRFAELIGRVHYGRDAVILERSGNPMAVILPLESAHVGEAGGGDRYLLEPVENVLQAAVVRHDPEGGVTLVETRSGTELSVPYQRLAAGAEIQLGVAAESIVLGRRSKPSRSLSARNVLPGRVTRVQARDKAAVVHVRAGETWRVRLTRAAVRELRLRPGRSVELIIKTHAIHRLELA